MSSAGRRAINLQPSRHFGFATLSPKGIRKRFAQDLGETEKTARHDGRNAVKCVVMLLHPFEVAAVIRKAAAVGGEQP
jgi:hypothetical protein